MCSIYTIFGPFSALLELQNGLKSDKFGAFFSDFRPFLGLKIEKKGLIWRFFWAKWCNLAEKNSKIRLKGRFYGRILSVLGYFFGLKCNKNRCFLANVLSLLANLSCLAPAGVEAEKEVKFCKNKQKPSRLQDK